MEGQPRRQNVVYIVLDDMGYASLGCFGNTEIETPNIDRLADEGLRYANFHTTAICSASRASLLTGIDHHETGVASLVEWKTGGHNGLGHIDRACATTAELLRAEGYATFAVGKWHLSDHIAPSGPYDEWPLGRGFDRYYGFLAGQTDQFHPVLTRDNAYVAQPRSAEEGYHLSEDLVDNTIRMVDDLRLGRPDTPFFLYLAFGATHSPLQAPDSYLEKYRGRFDEGWDVLRKRWLSRQEEIGVVPAGTADVGRNELVPAWDELSDDERRVCARHMEAFAAFLDHTDAQIGRLIDHLRETGQLDDTLVVLLSDNGAASLGGRDGMLAALSACRSQRGDGSSSSVAGTVDETEHADPVVYALAHLDDIGTERSRALYPAGWANALSAPFPWFKIWTHEGGIHDPLIVRAPRSVSDPGSVRFQYTHITDITPTVLDALGLSKADTLDGRALHSFTGSSFAESLSRADAADAHTVQHYEMMGNRAIYRDGWTAVVNHAMAGSYERDTWELYHTADDFSESHDVAGEQLELLAELKGTYAERARERGVAPLLGRIRWDAEGIPWVTSTEEGPHVAEFSHVRPPFILSDQDGVVLGGSHERVEVWVDRDERGGLGSGALFSAGDRFGGISLFVLDGRAWVCRAIPCRDPVLLSAAVPDSAAGPVVIGYEASRAPTGGGDAAGGSASDPEDGGPVMLSLLIGGVPVALADIGALPFLDGPRLVCLGGDPVLSVSDAYRAPFVYARELRRVRIQTSLTPLDRAARARSDLYFE